MLNTYELEITCKCPVDDMPDVYQLTVTAQRAIPVEDILTAVKELSGTKLYQEDLCQALHRKVNACCVLIGYHSGVKVRSQCGVSDRLC
jgi:hypothetical protein